MGLKWGEGVFFFSKGKKEHRQGKMTMVTNKQY